MRAVDDITAGLLATLAGLTAHATDPGPATDAARIAAMEGLRSALAAAQNAELVAFARDQVDQQIARIGAARLDPAAVGATLRHLDRIDRHRTGRPTSFTNRRGTCARGNYVREMPGWHVEVLDDGLGERPHTVRTTTPTGRTYLGTAWPVLGRPPPPVLPRDGWATSARGSGASSLDPTACC